jgi:hypothetical protein
MWRLEVMYKGHKGAFIDVLEPMEDQDLWIWYAFFDMLS